PLGPKAELPAVQSLPKPPGVEGRRLDASRESACNLHSLAPLLMPPPSPRVADLAGGPPPLPTNSLRSARCAVEARGIPSSREPRGPAPPSRERATRRDGDRGGPRAALPSSFCGTPRRPGG